MLKSRSVVQNLRTYHPPLGGRHGLRLDFNENTVGCSPRVLERIRNIGVEDLARYPEREPVEVIAADLLGIRQQELLLTNGVDEAIHLVCQTYLEVDDEVLVVVPTFAMYEIFASATGARIVKIPAGQNFTFPTDDVLRHITAQTRLIAIANPNNPTGAAAPLKDLLLIARSAPNAAILIDEAYYEFHGETLLRGWVDRPNLFVARTFSKAYGLAGLRAGLLMGCEDSMKAVRKVASPYSVNAVALTCVPEALGDLSYVNAYVREVCEGRTRLQEELKRLAIPFWPSRANFVLLQLGTANAAFIRGMRERGILVRDRSRDPGCEGCVRITLGSIEQTNRLLHALRETLSQIGASRQEVTPVRKARIHRPTKETDIRASLNIDGHGRYKISTGIHFFDHMLELFTHHGGFDLELKALGDLNVDQHHTVEDVGIVLGQAFDKALGNKKGILRAGYFLMPMDETLGMAAVDFCGRTAISVNTKVNVRLVGDLQAELVHDFFEGFARGARANVHTRVLYGRSNHHKIESLFKAFARAVRAACWKDKRMAQFIPSTKGVL